MPVLLNLAYLLLLVLLSPWLAYKAITTGKYRRGMLKKFLGQTDHRLLDESQRRGLPIVWFHGVSVGEVHLLRQVVARFRQRRPDCGCVISTTTDTGFEEAQKCFADLPVILWPLDFTWAVERALWTVQPQLVVLAEGELWPNFLLAAKRFGVRVAVINGRMSPRSRNRYRLIRPLARRLFSRVELVAAQTEEYAENFRWLGAKNVKVTGSVKYDGATGQHNLERSSALRTLFALAADDLIWIAGSTQDPEERIAVDIYRRLRAVHPNLRLLLVPRQKDRFDEVAQMLERSELPFVRRSRLSEPAQDRPIILVDTIGELSALWPLADVAYVGGSLDGKRGGQNMIEPAALGSAAVLFGPHTWNFKETVTQLLQRDAAIQVADADQLESAVRRLLSEPDLRTKLGQAARQFVLSQQGATDRTLELLEPMLPAAARRAA